MSRRRGRPRPTAATGQRPSTKPAGVRYRIVIYEINDGNERPLADYTAEGYVAAIGRRLPRHQFEHNTLRVGPPDLTLSLASVIPDAMAGSSTSTCAAGKRIQIGEHWRKGDGLPADRVALRGPVLQR